jgi:serine/threonine protein kinase
VAIIKPRAGYFLKTISGEEKIAIKLADMGILFRQKELLKQDELVFLNMIEKFLIGVKSLHDLGILHRDLKPDNILCSKEGEAGVTDLGTICSNKILQKKSLTDMDSKIHLKEPNHDNFDLKLDRKEPDHIVEQWVSNPEKNQIVGSPYYMSPEMVYYNLNDMPWKIDFAVDIWSVGLILWESLSGEPLLKHHVFDAMRNIKSHTMLVRKIGDLFSDSAFTYDLLYLEPEHKSSLAHLVWNCTRRDPTKRPTIDQVIKRFQLWKEHVKKRVDAGEVKSLHECYAEGS